MPKSFSLSRILDAIESKLEGSLGWYESLYDRRPLLAAIALFAVISVLVILVPLFLWAEFRDIYQAFSDVLQLGAEYKTWAYIISFVVWLVFVIFTGLILRRHLMLLVTMLRLSVWCSLRGCAQISRSVLEINRPITWSWTEYLKSATDNQRIQLRTSAVAYEALVFSYLDGLGRVRRGEPLSDSSIRTDPILPSNFLLYARCVEQIREKVAERYGKSTETRVAIRTLLTRNITWWYNIQRVHLQDDQELRCTTKWWELYKEGIRNKSLKSKGISLHRLLRFDPQQENSDIQKSYFKLQISHELNPGREYLTAKEFQEVRAELAPNLRDEIDWLAGAENLPVEDLPTEYQELHLNPICKLKQPNKVDLLKDWSSSNTRYVFTSAYEHYREYHDSVSACDDAPLKHGAWCKQIHRNDVNSDHHWIKDYNDLFIVDFYSMGARTRLLARFGISYLIEESKDMAGIRLLSHKDLDDVVTQFDAEWKRANIL